MTISRTWSRWKSTVCPACSWMSPISRLKYSFTAPLSMLSGAPTRGLARYLMSPAWNVRCKCEL